MKDLLKRASRCVGKNMLAVAVLATVGIYGVTTQETQWEWDRPDVAGSPGAVLEKHRDECWAAGEEALTDEVSTHVIWQYLNGPSVYTDKMVHEAFGEVFNGADHPGRVIAFCK